MMKLGVILSYALSDVPAFARSIPLVNELSKYGNEITLYVPSGGESSSQEALNEQIKIRKYGRLLFRNIDSYRKTKYYSFPQMSLNIVYSFFDLFRQLNRERFDMLIMFKSKPNNAIALVLKKLLCSSTTLIIDRDDLEQAYTKSYAGIRNIPWYASMGAKLAAMLERKSIELSDGVTVVSEKLKDETVRWVGSNEKVCNIPNCIYPWRFKIATEEMDELQEKTKTWGGEAIVFPAVLKSRKIVMAYFLPELITSIMPQVVKQVPGTKLVIIGEGDFKNELMELVAKHGLQQNVLFCDWIPNVELHKLLTLAKVGILPLKDTELTQFAAPLKLVEFMAAGLGIVATDVGDIKEVLKDCGIVVDSGDYKSFADGIVTLLKNGELRNKLGKRAEQKAAQEYNWEVVGKRLNQFLNAIMGRKREQYSVGSPHYK
jgi:glycosyltransferase involved in cell wall biosynthesis